MTRIIAMTVAAAFLVGCGGGGGSSSAPVAGGSGSSLQAPRNVEGAQLENGMTRITWEDASRGEVSYRVFAAELGVPVAQSIAMTPSLPADTETADINLDPGKRYQVEVIAFGETDMKWTKWDSPVIAGADSDPRMITGYFSLPAGVYFENTDTVGSDNSSIDTGAPAVVGGVVIGLQERAQGQSDFYQVTDVPAGSQVVLEYLEGQTGEDLDIEVIDESGAIHAFSAAPALQDEQATVTIQGNYAVRVLRETANGAGAPQKYALAIITPGQSVNYLPRSTTLARSAYSSSADIKPYQATAFNPRGAYVSKARSSAVAENTIYTNAEGGTINRVRFEQARLAKPRSARSSGKVAVMEQQLETLRLLKRYARLNPAESVKPVIALKQASVTVTQGGTGTSDPLGNSFWQFQAHSGDEGWLWTRGKDSSGDPVTVAVIDAGIFPNGEFGSRLLDGEWIYRDEEDPFGPLVVVDDQEVAAKRDGSADSHGNLVAAIIAAERNNALGAAGFLPEANILPVRANSPANPAYDSGALEAALQWATDNGADVINFSIGGAEGGWSIIKDGVIYAINNDVPVIAAGGNSGSRFAPSNVVEALNGHANGAWAVSAYAQDGSIASYSDYGPYISLTAIIGDFGEEVCHTGVVGTTADPLNPDQSDFSAGTVCDTGTSFSTPIVSAAVGMMKAINPALTNAQLQAALQAGSLTRPDSGGAYTEEAGYGVIDFEKAAEFAASGQLSTAMIQVSGDADFAGYREEIEITIDRVGFPGHSLEFTGLPFGVTVEPAVVDDAGFGTYVVAYNRALAGPDSIGATVTVTTNEGKSDTFVVTGYTLDPQTQTGSFPIDDIQVDIEKLGSIVGSASVVAFNDYVVEFREQKADVGLNALSSGEHLVIVRLDVDGDGVFGEPGEIETTVSIAQPGTLTEHNWLGSNPLSIKPN